MMIGIGFFPAVIDYASPQYMFTTGANVDVVAHRMNRNNPFGFAIFRAQHHPRFNGVARFADINWLFINKHLACGDTRAAKQPFH